MFETSHSGYNTNKAQEGTKPTKTKDKNRRTK